MLAPSPRSLVRKVEYVWFRDTNSAGLPFTESGRLSLDIIVELNRGRKIPAVTPEPIIVAGAYSEILKVPVLLPVGRGRIPVIGCVKGSVRRTIDCRQPSGRGPEIAVDCKPINVSVGIMILVGHISLKLIGVFPTVGGIGVEDDLVAAVE